MTAPSHIPVFALYGQTTPFPDIVYIERLADRAASGGWRIDAHRHGQLSQVIIIDQKDSPMKLAGVLIRKSPGENRF